MAANTYGPNVAVVQKYSFHIAALTVAAITAMVNQLVEQKIKIESFSAVFRAKTGTHVTSTLALKNGANTVSTISIAGAAGTRVDGTINTLFEVAAKGAVLTIDVAESGGTTPANQDLDIEIGYVALY